jgi:hypothetical protein
VRNVEFYRQLNKEVSGNNMQRHDLLVVKVVPVMVRKESRENHGPVKDLCIIYQLVMGNHGVVKKILYTVSD